MLLYPVGPVRWCEAIKVWERSFLYPVSNHASCYGTSSSTVKIWVAICRAFRCGCGGIGCGDGLLCFPRLNPPSICLALSQSSFCPLTSPEHLHTIQQGIYWWWLLEILLQSPSACLCWLPRKRLHLDGTSVDSRLPGSMCTGPGPDQAKGSVRIVKYCSQESHSEHLSPCACM